ncbi:MAG: hypothetical protein GEU92_19035 [Alphaproteobacteria bacterium]|nr:hypothetical protein [Alphaproteobacteria bacterium]
MSKGKGGGGGGSGTDPVATAQAQGAANKEAVRESALVNQINQRTPFGNETYTGAIGSPGRTRTVSLTPEGQAQLNAQNRIGTGLLGVGENSLVPQVQGALGTPLNFDGLQEISGQGDLENYGAGLEEATFQRGENLLRPGMDRAREMEHTRLANQGLPESGEAYDEAIGRLDQSQQAQLENLALSSVGAGRQEQSRLAGLEQQIRQQGISERLTERGQPINELSALLQGAPAIGLPQFQAPSQYAVGAAPYLGATGLSAQIQNQGANRQNDLYGGLIGAGGQIGAGLLG